MQQNYIEEDTNNEHITEYESTGAMKGVLLSLTITAFMYIISLFVN